MSVWYALSGTVAIRPTPEARRVVDAFNRLGVELEAELEDHDDGTATVVFRGGDFVAPTTAGAIEDKALELAPYVTRPARLDVDRDGERGVLPLGGPEAPESWTITLVDGAEGAVGTVEIQLDCEGSCLEIRPRGYGEAEAADGHGAPVLLELYGGRLRLVVAPDIHDPARQVIDLERARESSRV